MGNYLYQIIREGDCLYEPDKKHPLEGRAGDPTITLVYPREKEKSFEYVLVDPGLNPYFSSQKKEKETLTKILGAVSQIQPDFSLVRIFVTHPHLDHCSLVRPLEKQGMRLLNKDKLLGREIIYTPGHCPEHYSLLFQSEGKRIVVAGDAVINLDYFIENEFYRPNNYSYQAAKQTLETMARLKEVADVIIPGHGKPFHPKEIKQRTSGSGHLKEEDFPEEVPKVRVYF